MGQHERTAVLVVDVQNDFCPGGALPVSEGDRVVPVLNSVIEALNSQGATVYASRDWHPEVTTHFKAYGGTWPPHCIARTEGAAYHPALRLPAGTVVISKGQESGADGYSAFEGTTAAGTALLEDLRSRGITTLVVGGLATDYCVRASVLDARKAGLEVVVVDDAIAGVDVQPGDSARARDDMKAAGARFAPAREIAESRWSGQSSRPAPGP
jgi:nicotinamidase/pyrazinamidase